ncbi:MAG: hypothetical protein GY822_24030 [Deltaproteobacteria bacterium]|nr:hypothetical protein [Deltaproteobacteria bacterium]
MQVIHRFYFVHFLPVLVLCSALFGCPTPDATDAGGPAIGADGGAIAPGPGVSVDLGCSVDSTCGEGQICNLENGLCETGYDCSGNPGLCEFCGEAGFDCGFGGNAYCDDEAGV